MPTGDSKIKFSVEGVTQLHQSFQSILNDSKALTEEWARQGDLITKSLEKQINLLKSRNSSALFPNNPISSQQFKTEGTDLKSLETFLDSVKSDGIKLNDETLKELANLIKTSMPVSESGKPQIEPKEHDQKDSEKIEKEDTQTKFFRNLALTSLLRPLQSNDPFESGIGAVSNTGNALMAMGGKAGIIGAGLAAVAEVIGAKYSKIANVAPTAAQTARLLGGSWEDWTISSEGAQYGLNKNETLQRRMSLAQAMGKQNLGNSFDQALLWESSTMLTSSDIASFARSGRGDKNFDLSRNLSSYFEILKRTGVSNEKIQTQMSEYLRELVSLNTMQLEQFGKSDTNLNTALYSVFSSALPQTAEANPALIGRLAGQFYSKLSTAPSKSIEALQYSIASRNLGSSGSWYQARMMREDPFGLAEGLSDEQKKQRRNYVRDLLKSYRTVSSDTDQFAYLLEKQFGFSSNIAWNLANTYSTGNFNIDEFKREAEISKQKNQAEEEMRTKLPNMVDGVSKIAADWETFVIGKKIEAITTAVERIHDILKFLNEKPKIERPSLNMYSPSLGVVL